MKVLVITDQFSRGGADRVTSVMCNELFDRGYEIQIIADTVNCRVSYYVNPNIPINQIVASHFNTGKIATIKKWIKIVKDIRNYIKEINPDLIIAIASKMYLCSLIANMGRNKPLIVVDHTSFSRKQHPLIDLIRYKLYGFADGISILTKKDYELLGNKYPQKRVIYNPLSFPVLDYPTERRNNILCAGRMEVWHIKGFDIILDIWKQIENKYPDWILEFAGDCESNIKNEVESMVISKGLANRVRFLGFVSDMKELYSHSSIFALCSRMEGFPMVLMEAMSQGCACVAFSIGGSTNEMMDEDSGFIVDDGDISEFRNKMEELISNEDIRHRFSNNSINKVSKFSVSSFGDNWESFIYDTIRKN